MTEQTPDHSTLSRTRRLYPLETHRGVFRWLLRLLEKEGLLDGQTIRIDATTLEANAALRSIRRRDNGKGYEEYLRELAQAEGIEKPTREQLARLDRKRKNILKRLLIHAAGFNLALLVRGKYGMRKPRTLQGVSDRLLIAQVALWTLYVLSLSLETNGDGDLPLAAGAGCGLGARSGNGTLTTGC